MSSYILSLVPDFKNEPGQALVRPVAVRPQASLPAPFTVDTETGHVDREVSAGG
jgi:hypothetical protein